MGFIIIEKLACEGSLVLLVWGNNASTDCDLMDIS